GCSMMLYLFPNLSTWQLTRGSNTGSLRFHHQPILSHRVVTQYLAFENPDLDTDNAISSQCFMLGIVDIGAQRMKRHAAFTVPFNASNFCSAQTATTNNFNTFSAQTQSRLNSTLHSAAESNTADELVTNALCHQLCVNFGLANFNNVQRHIARRHFAQFTAQFLDIRTLFTDDNTGAGSIDGYAASFGRTLDHNLGDRSLWHGFQNVFPHLDVFHQEVAIIGTIRIPAAIPSPVNLQAKPDRITLLTHGLRLFFLRFANYDTNAAKWLDDLG